MSRARFGLLVALCLLLLSLSPVSGRSAGEEFTGEFLGRVTLSDTRSARFADVSVVLTGDRILERQTPSSSGRFRFADLPSGRYQIQVRKPGFQSPAIRTFSVGGDGSISQVDRTFRLDPLPSDRWVFHWEDDETESGYEYASQTYVNQPVEVEFLDRGEELADASASSQLLRDYNVALVNDGDSQWSAEHATRLMRTMETIPQEKRDAFREQTLPASRWYLESGHLVDDIVIETRSDGTRDVCISEDAFVYANPKLVRIDGKRGRFFSQKLHHALVRFVTDGGRDERAFERILQERYGVTTQIPSYRNLTVGTTRESASRFQEFHPEEVVQIINMFEEMPRGMHRIEGLKYLVRRLDGTPHPLYDAAAVAWAAAGYIEFMDKAFTSADIFDVHRLIIHEKVHFLWAFVFNDQLKEDWIDLGGWYRVGSGEWRTTKSTEFVRAYAHGINPEEDLAESIPFFILNPDYLRSVALEKYEFIRDRIMHGNVYIPQIREDLTFEVFNLWPDYVQPGKIKRVDIEVIGLPSEDKNVRVEIELHAQDRVFEGATQASMRVYSESGRYFRLTLYPGGENTGTPGTVLSGSVTISRFDDAGFWAPSQITLSDGQANRRYQDADDFGWSLFINNNPDDAFPSSPEYVPGTINLAKSQHIPEVQVVEVSWLVDADPRQIRRRYGCFVRMNDDRGDTYSHDEYGHYDPVDRTCTVHYLMPSHMPGGDYTVAYIAIIDVLNAWHSTYFGYHGYRIDEYDSESDEASPVITLVTSRSDISPPEVDVNRIGLDAEPAYPDRPNGETYVTVTLFIRDDISGLKHAYFTFRDPQGKSHNFLIDMHVLGKLYSYSEPGQWTRFRQVVLLPAGSAPGIWGLSSMDLRDKVGNIKQYDFVEILHFEVEQSGSPLPDAK